MYISLPYDLGMRQLPPLAAVRAFEAAARHGNFTRAAAELGMTQAAISYQIRLLEERLGAPLFQREHGRVKLTDVGRAAARPLGSAFDAIDEAFRAVRAVASSVLVISSANSFAANWLAPRLGEFQLRHPDLAVRLDATDTVADFARDPVDIAIRSTREPGPGLHAERLFENRFTAMASPALLERHPVARPADLLELPRLNPDDAWWTSWFEAAGVPDSAAAPRRGGLQLDSQIVEGAAALAGQGVALLNTRTWQREIDAGRLLVPIPVFVQTGSSFWLVCAEVRRNVPKIRQFREWLVAEAKADAAAHGTSKLASP